MSDTPPSKPEYHPRSSDNTQGDTRPNKTDPKQTNPADDLEDTSPIKVSGPRKIPSFNTPSDDQTPPSGLKDESQLPQRVDESDLDATRVTPAAYSPSVGQGTQSTRPSTGPAGRETQIPPQAPPPLSPPRTPPKPRKRVSPSPRSGCMFRVLAVGIFVFVLLGLCGLSIGFFQYYRIASTLPDINDLRNSASQFETTRILDRNGNVLYEILDPNAGRRTFVPLERISPYLVAATIATEDKGFYSHPGFDLIAIGRAFFQNYQGGATVSGASTITQQLARALLFSPEERVEQSYSRKLREAILAAEITRRYSKDEILELYLNENFYGNLAYGVEAAAETYFGKTVDQLTLGEAAFLAGLPQAPAIYDIYSNPEATFNRHEDVLVIMYQLSQEEGCIYVSNSAQRVCLDPVMVTIAASEVREHDFKPPDIQIIYPHWVTYVRSVLEEIYDPQTIYRSGFTVYTSLDPGTQDMAQQAVADQVAQMKANNASNGALVVMRPASGEILAMVGSADFYNEAISGQVNMAVAPRQPGSSIKPLTYLAAFEKGWTPATLLWDVPSEFPPSGRADDTRAPYIPVNYDGKFHGPVTVRSALANSYNIPAVKALAFVGIYDNPETEQPDGLIPFAERMGITTLTRPDYGLSLTLGGGDVTLLEMVGAFATMANNGRRIAPVAITRIVDNTGQVVFEHQQQAGQQVIRAEHAYMISSILADNGARTPAFGRNSTLNLPFPSAAKTGTTNDFRDNWTIGYTPDVAVGVWVGNADYTPMVDTSGLSGAAPIWAKVMQSTQQALTGDNPTPFLRPGGVVERVVCEISGTLPSQWCPEQTSEIFAADQPPLPKEQDLWQKLVIDTWTGLRASAACPDFTDETFVLNVKDQFAKKWIKKDPKGIAWAEAVGFEKPVTFTPGRECDAGDPRPMLVFTAPRDFESINKSPLDIYGIVDATDGFDFARLEYGAGEKPVKWKTLAQGQQPFKQPGLLHSWEMVGLDPGVYTLRLYLRSKRDTEASTEIRINIQVPTPTPTPTMTPTPTPTSTMTPVPTNTLLPPTWTPILPTLPFPTIVIFPTITDTPAP